MSLRALAVVVLALVSARAHAEDDDPCAPGEPAASATPADADGYAAIGDEQRALGAARTAAVAYREALRHDPAHERARAGLREVCAELEEARSQEFLSGLSALREGRTSEAIAAFDAATADPELAADARALRRRARRRPRWGLILLAQTELDSNVALLPTDAPPSVGVGDPEADGSLGLAAQGSFRPLGDFTLALGGSLRKQLRLAEYDRQSAAAAAAWLPQLGAVAIGVRYGANLDVLGGELAGLYQRVEAEVGGAAWRAGYRLLHRHDQLELTRGLRGLEHRLSGGATLRPGQRWALGAEAAVLRASTASDELAHWAFEGGVAADGRLGEDLGVGLASVVGWARYDGGEPASRERRDLRIDVALDARLDLSDRFELLASIDAGWNLSSIDDFDHWQIVVSGGVAVYLGGP